MEYPKMLYSAAEKVADQEALKAGLRLGTIKTLIVASAEAEAAAEEFTADLASLIKRGPGRTKSA